MNVLSITGLDANQVAPIVKGLQQLLADFQVYYANLRGYHWHVRGPQFFTLHSQFEKMYDEAAESVDEIAERILQLGATPENRFSEYLKISQLKEQTNVSAASDIISAILESLRVLIAQERAVLALADEAGDTATSDLLSDLLDGQVLSRDELVSELVQDKRFKGMEEQLRSGWGALLKPLAWQGALCYGPSRSSKVTFTNPASFLKNWNGLPDPAEAAPAVIKRYLSAYGPATPEICHEQVVTDGPWNAADMGRVLSHEHSNTSTRPGALCPGSSPDGPYRRRPADRPSQVLR